MHLVFFSTFMQCCFRSYKQNYNKQACFLNYIQLLLSSQIIIHNNVYVQYIIICIPTFKIEVKQFKQLQKYSSTIFVSIPYYVLLVVHNNHLYYTQVFTKLFILTNFLIEINMYCSRANTYLYRMRNQSFIKSFSSQKWQTTRKLTHFLFFKIFDKELTKITELFCFL